MRWEKPQAGTEEIIKAFLWWPKTIDGLTRWLEVAVWRRHYSDKWIDVEWIDLEKITGPILA